MVKTVYPPFWVGAIMAGLSLVLVDVYSNVQFMMEQSINGFLDSNVIGVICLALGTAIALPAAARAARTKHIVLAFGLLIGFLIGAAFSLTATLDRVASQRDAKLGAIWKADDLMRSLVEEHKRLNYAASRECATGRGKRCAAAEEEVGVSKNKIAQREAELDSMGRRISGLTNGRITVHAASLFQPNLMPLGLFLLGNLLIAFGAAGVRVKPEFDVGLTGRDAVQAKAARYIAEYEAVHGKRPPPSAISATCKVSKTVAQTALRKAARR